MPSDRDQTPLASSITISDAPSSSETAEATGFIGKTVRDHFFVDIKTIDEKNSWEATCNLCKTTVRGTKGVTSNFNRHVKEFHKSRYEIWLNEMEQKTSSTQKKITSLMVIEKAKRSDTASPSLSSNHPRQIELEKSIIEDLIIELGLPLSLVERQGFINFMNHVDSRFKMISRRTLTRNTLPNIYAKMMDGLQSFCTSAKCISLTLDLWSDRRQRAFFALTGKRGRK